VDTRTATVPESASPSILIRPVTVLGVGVFAVHLASVLQVSNSIGVVDVLLAPTPPVE